MTRTNVMASGRPQAADAAPMRRGSPSVLRRLSALPIVLLLAIALAVPATALAASTTTGYNQTPPQPTPNSGTSPSKATKTPTTPAKTVSPATASSTPSATKPAKASTLPFTGFDLRWTVGAGLLLVCAGGSIMVMARRRRDMRL
jgi:hypothetical protein